MSNTATSHHLLYHDKTIISYGAINMRSLSRGGNPHQIIEAIHMEVPD
jgi:hypothetical protein